MSNRFTPAVKREQRLRMIIMGPSGCGKTYTAVQVGAGLLGDGDRMAVIDSEHASAAWYSDLAPFDHCELSSFSPVEYMAAMTDAAKAGYAVVVIDGLTQAWSGRDGILEQVDRAKSGVGGNQFAAWKDASPLHRRFIDAILTAPYHVIATVRAKTQWALEKNAQGKLQPQNLGIGPEQREGLEFEFDLVCYQDLDHTLSVHKSRLHSAGLDGSEHECPGREFGAMLLPHLSGTGEWRPPAVDGQGPQRQANPEEQARCAAALCRAADDATAQAAVAQVREACKAAEANGDLSAEGIATLKEALATAKTRLAGQPPTKSNHRVLARLLGVSNDVLADPSRAAIDAWVAETDTAVQAGHIREGGEAQAALAKRRAELEEALDVKAAADEDGDDSSPSDREG